MQALRISGVLSLVLALGAPAWAAGPTGHITINRNAPVTFSSNVTLNLWATDDAAVTGYFVSANPTPPAADAPGWVVVGPTASFGANVPSMLSAGTGTKTVYAWYRDAAGNVSPTASDDILLQAAPVAGGPLPAIALQQVASGLALPVAIAHAGDGSGRLFIALQAGKIVIFDGTQVLSTPFLDLNPPPPDPPKVLCCGEQGLLGLAFHPNYAANGFLYVYYTNPSGENVVARYSVSANPNLADPNSEVILLSVPNPQTNHNGGQLKFGFDGYLYIAKGDGGTGGGPARTLDNLLGKILRIDVDAGLPYGIPPTNPFVGTPGAQPEIWAFGLRNPWRFTFDRLTGDIFIGDVGEGAREEVNLQPAASDGGENYGWSRMEGSLCRTPAPECTNGTLVLPILEYNHDSAGGCSITGGYRYRGSGIPDLYGAYFYGDFCSGRIWGATPDAGGGWTATQMLDTSHNISTFGEDESGELYVAHRPTTAGALYRIVAAANPVPVTTGTNPPSATAGGPSFTLTVSGTSFAPNAVVRWNGGNRDTQFISSTELRATIPAGDIAAAGNAAVTVFNPAPGGGTSNAQTFTISAAQFTLTVTRQGNGTGTVTLTPPDVTCAAACSEVYASGSGVALSGDAAAGSMFGGFTGDGDCVDGQVTMTANRTCIATFTLTGTFLADDFNRPNSTSLGPNWTEVSGNWTIASNQLSLATAASGAQIVRTANALPQANYRVQSQVTPLTGSGYVGLVARLVNSTNYYTLRLRADQDTVALFRVVDGVFTFLGNAYTPPGGIALGTTYALRLTVTGTQISGDFSPDGGTTWVPVASVADSSFAGPGFAGYLSTNSTMRGDNFSVVAFGAPPFLADDFNRPDSTTLGPNWIEVTGDWTIASNQLALPSPTAGTKKVRTAAALPQPDYRVQSQVTPLSGAGYGGLMARAAPSTNNYYLLRLRVDQGTVALLRDGTTILGSPHTPPAGLTLGATYALRLTVQGTQITGEFSPDGGTTWVTVASVQDGTYPGPGHAGYLGAYGTSLRADNFLTVGP